MSETETLRRDNATLTALLVKLQGEYQVALAELRALRIWKTDVALAADQQHANEPEPTADKPALPERALRF